MVFVFVNHYAKLFFTKQVVLVHWECQAELEILDHLVFLVPLVVQDLLDPLGLPALLVSQVVLDQQVQII